MTAWLSWAKRHGFRNAQVTVIAPTGTIGLVMDCDTTGIEPDFALVKFKKLAGGGYFKIINQSVPPALAKLGYARGRSTTSCATAAAPHARTAARTSTPQRSRRRASPTRSLKKIESQLPGRVRVAVRLQPLDLGDDFLKNTPQGARGRSSTSPTFDLLTHLGFTKQQVAEANDYVCGSMTIEGAAPEAPSTCRCSTAPTSAARPAKRFLGVGVAHPHDGRRPAVHQRGDLEDDQHALRRDRARR